MSSKGSSVRNDNDRPATASCAGAALRGIWTSARPRILAVGPGRSSLPSNHHLAGLALLFVVGGCAIVRKLRSSEGRLVYPIANQCRPQSGEGAVDYVTLPHPITRNESGFCVSTVSIVGAIKVLVPVRAEEWVRPAPCALSLTRLTVLTVLWDRFSPRAVILIVRVPNRPSRPKTISIPRVRRRSVPGAADQRVREDSWASQSG